MKKMNPFPNNKELSQIEKVLIAGGHDNIPFPGGLILVDKQGDPYGVYRWETKFDYWEN